MDTIGSVNIADLEKCLISSQPDCNDISGGLFIEIYLQSSYKPLQFTKRVAPKFHSKFSQKTENKITNL